MRVDRQTNKHILIVKYFVKSPQLLYQVQRQMPVANIFAARMQVIKIHTCTAYLRNTRNTLKANAYIG